MSMKNPSKVKSFKRNLKCQRPSISFSTTSFARIITFTTIIHTRRLAFLEIPPDNTKPTETTTLSAKQRYCFSISHVSPSFKIAAIRPQQLAICRGSPPDWILPFTNYAFSKSTGTEIHAVASLYASHRPKSELRSNTEIVSRGKFHDTFL